MTTSRTWLPPEEYAKTLPKATVFGSVFFTDEHDHPVHLRAVYTAAHPWQWPGGVTEHGERPWETAVRECEEETGLVVPGLHGSWRRSSGCRVPPGPTPRQGSSSTAAGSPPGSSRASGSTRTSTTRSARCP
ncbi:NUDIX hydrolase [Streptomyces sp. NPDC001774]